jgi:hypothetical protein
MIDYVDEIVTAYDKVLSKLDDGFNAVKKKSNPARTSTAPDGLFVVNEDAEKLSEEGSTAFHNLVAKTLYVSKHARPDVSTAIAFLTTRVRAPDIDDWRKLSHLMEYPRMSGYRHMCGSTTSSTLKYKTRIIIMTMMMMTVVTTRMRVMISMKMPFQMLVSSKGL